MVVILVRATLVRATMVRATMVRAKPGQPPSALRRVLPDFV